MVDSWASIVYIVKIDWRRLEGLDGKMSNDIYDLSNVATFFQPSPDLCLALVGDNFPPGAESLLSPSEAREGQRRQNPEARRQWLAGRLAAKAAAGRRWNIAPGELEILSGPEGEPRLGPADAARGFVSISHTRGAAAAAVAGGPVGLDLENHGRLINDRVWRWAFSADERRLAENSPNWPARLALWCAREAASKYWRRPLLNNLQRLRITGADWARGRLQAAWLGPQTAGVEVRLMVHRRNWLIALAADWPDGEGAGG